MKKVTQKQAQTVLEAIEKRFEPWIAAGGDAPKLIMDFDWLDVGPSPAIIWEGGPYEWALLDPAGDIEEEFGLRIPPMELPAEVWTEPVTSWALGIHLREVLIDRKIPEQQGGSST